MNCRSLTRCIIAVFVMLVLPIAFATSVQAQANTCNGQIAINYLSGQNYGVPGDTYRVELSLGTQSITGGTEMTVNRIRFELDCASAGVPCTDDGSVVKYKGDTTISTNCTDGDGNPVGWTSNASDITDPYAPNDVVFTPTAPVVIPANTSLFCTIEFDVEVGSYSNDATPNIIEQYTGFNVANSDATCDNGLKSGSQQSGSINLCPNCDDGLYCNGTETCDQSTGQCVDGTDVICPDIFFCADEFCNEDIDACDSTDTSATVCPPDAFFCADNACDETANACVQTDKSATVCPPDAFFCADNACDETANACVQTDKSATVCPDTLCQVCDEGQDACVDKDPLPAECLEMAICRTPGFWGTHGTITSTVLGAAGGCIQICGDRINNIAVDNTDSALEAMCINKVGGTNLQLVRMLTAAALNCIVTNGSETCTGISSQGVDIEELFNDCNAACASGSNEADVDGEMVNCSQALDCFNNGGKYDDGTCWYGTCEGSMTLCVASTYECNCIPFEDNCHDMYLCSETSGLCFEASDAEVDCSGWDICWAAPGPADTSKECNQATKSATTVVGDATQSCP